MLYDDMHSFVMWAALWYAAISVARSPSVHLFVLPSERPFVTCLKFFAEYKSRKAFDTVRHSTSLAKMA